MTVYPLIFSSLLDNPGFAEFLTYASITVYSVILVVCVLFFIAELCFLFENEKYRKSYMKRHPEYVAVQVKNVLREDVETRLNIRVYTVNGERAVFHKCKLLLPVGYNDIVADFKPKSVDKRDGYRFSDTYNRMTMFEYFQYKYKEEYAEKLLSNACRIRIDVRKDSEYIIDADPYDGTMKVLVVKNDKCTKLTFGEKKDHVDIGGKEWKKWTRKK